MRFQAKSYPSVNITYPALVELDNLYRLGKVEAADALRLGVVDSQGNPITDTGVIKTVIDQVKKVGANAYVNLCMTPKSAKNHIDNAIITDGINHIRLSILNSDMSTPQKKHLLDALGRDSGIFLQGASDLSSDYMRVSEELAQFEQLKQQVKDAKKDSGGGNK